MSQTIKKIFFNIDILSTSPKLRIFQHKSYKSLLGGILSLIIILLTIASIIYFGKDLISKKDPVSIVSAYSFKDIKFNMGVNDYIIYVAVEDSSFNYYNDPSIFNFTAYHKTLTLKSNGDLDVEYNNIEIKPCKNFYDNSTILKEGLDRDIFFCLKPNQFSIEGYWGNEINSFFGINLNRCKNSTENSNFCKSPEEINSKINGGILSIYSKNYLLDLKNLENPAKMNYDDIFYSLNIDFTFSLFIQLRKMEIFTDDGFIVENISSDIRYYSDKPHILYYGRRGDLLADIVIQNKEMGQQIKRSYIKFQDFLTKMGGLIKAFIMIGGFIINFTSEVEFYNDFIYKIYQRISIPNEKLRAINDLSNNYLTNKSANMTSLSKSKITKINNLVQSSNQNTKKNTKTGFQYNKWSNFKHYNVLKRQFSYSKLYNFIIQLCYCYKNNIIYKVKESVKKKFNKVLSIEILYEKIFMIEALSHYVFNEKQLINVDNYYVEKFFEKEDEKKKESTRIFNMNKESLLVDLNS